MRTTINQWGRMALVASLITSAGASAVPSGLDALATDVVIPKINGKTVPVELFPDTEGPTTVWVKPHEGKFIGRGVTASPQADCGAVKLEMDTARVLVRERNTRAKLIEEKIKGLEIDEKKLIKLLSDYITLQTTVDSKKSEKTSLETDIAALDVKIAAADEAIKKAQAEKKIAKGEVEIEELKRTIAFHTEERSVWAGDREQAESEIRKLKPLLKKLDLQLALFKGKVEAPKQALEQIKAKSDALMASLNDLAVKTEEALKKYATKFGAYAVYTSDFAPAEFLEALKAANRSHQFRWVPTITGSVEFSLPTKFQKEAPINYERGDLMLDVTWGSKEAGELAHEFRRKLLDEKDLIEDPIRVAQSRIADLQAPLTGTRSVGVTLSILGFCALREPAKVVPSDGGDKDTFKLSLNFTYPIKYAVKVGGYIRSYASLYELHKVTKSSSWFGLRHEEKQEHIKDMMSDENFHVTVNPISGAPFSLEESTKLALSLKQEMFYMLAEPYLDKSGISKPEGTGELGATKVGVRMMLIPNPWAQWAGFVLYALGEMFGSSSAENIAKFSQTRLVHLDYNLGFIIPAAGTLTIGNLTEAKLTPGNL